jgi:hypothetical protein
MNTIERAWAAFLAAIDEARKLNQRAVPSAELAELLRHARELLDVIEAEVAEQRIAVPREAAAALDQMRNRLIELESQVKPTTH